MLNLIFDIYLTVFSDKFLDDEETEIPEETLIARSTLSELCGEAAKLKTMGVLNQVKIKYIYFTEDINL